MFGSGYVTLFRWRGARVRLHWSIALGALIFGGFRFDPGFIVGFVLLVLLHEIGHALLVWRYGHRVRAIEVTGLGGACSWSGNATPFEEAAIAWGGVLAQGALFAATYAVIRFVAPPTTAFTYSLVEAFTGTNLWLIAVNLMPIPPLDGVKAWKILGAWRERRGAGVPYGSWRDAGPNAQRAWLDGMKKKQTLPDKPSRSAQRAIDDLLRRATDKQSQKDE